MHKACNDKSMKNTHLTFIHGWGCGPDIWLPLIEHFPDYICHNIDLGYTGEDSADPASLSDGKSIYITHSLGTMWALKNRTDHMSALIAINGFAAFKGFTSPRILKRMQDKLQKAPSEQMHDFWSAADLPHSNSINEARLKNGLDMLEHDDYTHIMKSLSYPVASIFADKDPILETNKMQKHWGDTEYTIIQNGGHNLPLSHHAECAKIIKDVINAL